MTQKLRNPSRPPHTKALLAGAAGTILPLSAIAHPGHLSDPAAHFAYHTILLLVGVGATAFIASRLYARRNKPSKQPATIRK